jgi:hypothetical protein
MASLPGEFGRTSRASGPGCAPLDESIHSAETPSSNLATAERIVVAHVDQVAALPITLFMRSCRLSVSAEEISCIRKTGSVVFRAHPSEFHSYGEFLGAGFHLWHGSKRYRFVHWAPYPADPGDPNEPVPKSAEALQPVISATAPAGIRVKPPMTFRAAMWASVAWSVSGALVVAAALMMFGYATNL